MSETKVSVTQLRGEIRNLEGQLGSARSELARIQSSCQHPWGESVYDPIVREATAIREIRLGHMVWRLRPPRLSPPNHSLSIATC